MVRKRPRVEHTEDWQELLPLFWWPEQREYERPLRIVLCVYRARAASSSSRPSLCGLLIA